MAEIYLMHSKHGVKIATMEMEAQYDESHGWVRFDPDDITDNVIDALDDGLEDPTLPDAEVEANVFQRRRGRPRLNKSE